MGRTKNEFQTIRSEGGLLPPDLLRRVVVAKGNLPGAKPEDYGLPAGERLNEAITQSWNRMRRHWADFRAAARNLPESEAGTGLTNDKWSVPLLRELGFGLLPTTAGPEIGGKTYAINRFFGTTAVHLVGCNLSLDRRAAGVRGATTNPHGLVQEFLNRSGNHLWAIVSNGLRFRVLRDNQALSRQSYLEFDLEAMFSGEVYSDFVLLWLMAHATRFAPQRENQPESCWLEQWTKVAEEDGTRALGDLRAGVEKALQILGEAFVSHPRNTALRESLRTEKLPLNDFHGQLLRTVYRLIFLFVAEDRTLDGISLLHPLDDSDAGQIARDRFAANYSTARLRELAGKIKGSRHGDLWQQFNLLVGALSGNDRFEASRRHLALPVLGSFLWSPKSTSALNASILQVGDGVELANGDFLESLRHLAFTLQGKTLRPVDYKNLGAEELGGVYESLLALTPQVSGDGNRFTFAEFAGNERKTSGSYYTPDSLVQCLLDSALDPVVEEALNGKSGVDAERAILSLKVCDPAVGSGHFLVGAAHRLARHLARVRANAQGESEPSPLLYQHALRDVIGRCLYGVDINPMSAELCRVGLWLEALEPGKPLSFLDHHIQVGNSLLGTTPALLAKGIPDEAFTPIEGDLKAKCTELKRDNKRERNEFKSGQGYLFDQPFQVGNLAAELAKIDDTPDDSAEGVLEKERRYAEMVTGHVYQSGRLLADTWCAAFVWKKNSSDLGNLCPTERTFRKVESNAAAGLLPHVHAEVEHLRNQYQFFHWHIAFPDVFHLPGNETQPENEQTGWNCGFDVVLGNPPWEMFEVKDDEFFAETNPDILAVGSAKDKAKLIERLDTDAPEIAAKYAQHVRDVAAENHLISASGRYPFGSQGRINLYRLFVETAQHTISQRGRFGLIIPTGFASDSFSSPHFRHFCETGMLHSLFDFENRERTLFPGVYYRTRFCLLTIKQKDERYEQKAFDFVFLATNVAELSDSNRHVRMTSQQLALLNPITKTAPFITSSRDLELTTLAHANGIPFASSCDSSWNISTMLMFMMNASMKDNKSFRDCESIGLGLVGNIFSDNKRAYLPLYEGKMIGMYSHRASSIRFDPGKRVRKSQAVVHTDNDLGDPNLLAMPMFWVSQDIVDARCNGKSSRWFVVVKDITSTTNERSVIGAIGPRAAYTHSVPCIFVDNECARMIACLLANLNSLPIDYVAKQKLSGLHLYGGVLSQLPVLPRTTFLQKCPWDSEVVLRDWIASRVLELSYTSTDIEAFARDIGYSGSPFLWKSDRRFELQRQLDAAFFHLYGYDRSMVSDILDRFRIIRDRELKSGGLFVTKQRTLELFENMDQTIGTCDFLK
jgi:hypothetical protein